MTIVVVDQDPDFRDALAANLRDDGHSVRVFAAADEVPPMDELGDADVLISDYQMHPQNGLALADQFHATHAAAPVVLVTTYWTQLLDAEVAKRKFLHVQRKPFDYEDLHALLESARRRAIRTA